MNPTEAGGLGIGLEAGGGITGAIGAFTGGIAQQQQFNYQAGIARLNAQISQQNATYAESVGESAAQRYGMQAAQRLGKIKVAQASSGFDVNTGTPKAIRSSEQRLAEMDLATIRSDAAKTAYDYRVQATGFGAQAGLDTIAGKNARLSGLISATSSIIGGAASTTGMYLRGTQLGMWGGQPTDNTQTLGSG